MLQRFYKVLLGFMILHQLSELEKEQPQFNHHLVSGNLLHPDYLIFILLKAIKRTFSSIMHILVYGLLLSATYVQYTTRQRASANSENR